MFDKVLVANRGEIAVRVMRACADLGIDTVAVYSEADKHTGHVRYADEAYYVGPAQAADSYLDHEAIIEAAEKANADAIHPGYGFLAENAAFARKVEDTDGVTWVGPSGDAMEELGEKTKVRTVMAEADVPIVPGTTDPVDDPAEDTIPSLLYCTATPYSEIAETRHSDWKTRSADETGFSRPFGLAVQAWRCLEIHNQNSRMRSSSSHVRMVVDPPSVSGGLFQMVLRHRSKTPPNCSGLKFQRTKRNKLLNPPAESRGG